MAPHAEKSRRKSLSLLSRASLSNLSQINTDVGNHHGKEDKEHKDKKKSGKRGSIFGSLAPTINTEPENVTTTGSPVKNDTLHSPKLRPRTLQKGRPSSLFGSLGRRSMTDLDEEKEVIGMTPESPLEDLHFLGPGIQYIGNSPSILHHGEVQTTTGMFRKKKEYLVLTDTHLIRFKSMSRAIDAFPQIQPANIRQTHRQSSTASIGSLQEVQSQASHASTEGETRIPLGQIVTVYKMEDGRPFFTTEVVYLDEDYHGVGSIQLMLHDPKEADLWSTSIRAAAQKARLMMQEPYPERVVRYLVQALEVVDDYDANHFQVFRVVKRTQVAKSSRSSSDDLQRLGSSVFYMVVGINRLHLIPLPDFSQPSTTLFPPKSSRNTYGLVSLVAMNVQYSDDRFELAFRAPLQHATLLDLAASATHDIAVIIFQAIQYLKPQWLDYNFTFSGPRRLLESSDIPLVHEEEEFGCFDRTLVAYCMAYNCNPVNIQYAVDWDVEDAPEFRLYRPASTAKYTIYELLAIFRSLRYNESFHSISFKDIDLHCMHGVVDTYGVDHIAWSTRTNISIDTYFSMEPQKGSLLYQEVQAIALKSQRLRRLDFSYTLPQRRPKDTFDEEGGVLEKDPGCEITSALMPLCQSQLTDVTWIVLNGIELGETDLDHIIPALNNPKAQIRAIECSRCGLTDRGIMQLLTHLERQNQTLECINISDNPGRILLERFQVSMSRFSKVRRLDLSRITRTSGEQPLFVPEVMISWKLEELILNGIPVNDATLDTIAAYLSSDMSAGLRILQMDQCNLTGSHVALLMRAMTRVSGEARDLVLHVSANRLEKGISDFVKAIKENYTPAKLVVRMIEFTKEEYFKQLLEALRTNTTIQVLDISKASLPYDASPETCEALQRVFAENKTLEDLDISGEQAHLEVTRFGIGLNQALTGLKFNNTLKSLRIEYQKLGLEGANTLSSVLEANRGLTHIFCEHNDINLQGFTILVNAIAKNTTILEVPYMHDDQDMAMKRMSASMRDTRRTTSSHRENHHVKSSVKRTLKSFGVGVEKPVKLELTSQDVDEVVRVLGEKWNTEIGRLAMFLERNRNIAMGRDGYDPADLLNDLTMRPTTALSDRGILEQVLSNTTPRVELGNPVEITNDRFSGMTPLADVLVNENRYGEHERRMDNTNTEFQLKPKRISYKRSTDGGLLPDLAALGNEKMFELDSGLFHMET
ncbi:leucine rich repeat protein [Rutstroemia sp. NJR-2017a WRK4]|nr:leucine rich repeat protein [Rutstroemia sp. NJR-2017a WRK4]